MERPHEHDKSSGSKARPTKGNQKTIFGERTTPTIAFSLSEGFEDRGQELT
jgi:hypothetical protein